MKRRMLAMFLCGLLLLAMTGCKDAEPAGTEEGTATPTATETPSEPTDEPTEAPTETPTPTEEVKDWRTLMIERSLVSTGNNYRLKTVMEKAAAGEDVYIAAIGGSITEGAGASINLACYAMQTYLSFAETYGKDGGSNVHFTNAGMSGTPSTLGMIRYDRDVIEKADGHQPDLVIVEFAVNDGDDPTKGDAYESLVRKILSADNAPAVILVFSVFQSQWNLQDRLKPIGEYYDLPMVSIKDAVVPAINAGDLTNAEFFASDTLHPINNGHEIMKDCITYLLATVAEEEKAAEDIVIPDEPKVGASFVGVQMLDAATEGVAVTAGSFSETDSALGGFHYGSGKTFPNNWMHAAGSNDPLTMTLTCKNLLLVYKQSSSASFGTAEVYVDGELVTSIEGKTNGGWNNPYTVVVFNEETAAEHTIEVRMAEGSEDKNFTICAFGYTE